MSNPWGLPDEHDAAGGEDDTDTEAPDSWDERAIDADIPDDWDTPVEPRRPKPRTPEVPHWPAPPAGTRTVTVDPLAKPTITAEGDSADEAPKVRQMLVTIPEDRPKPAATVLKPNFSDSSRKAAFVRSSDTGMGKLKKGLSGLFRGDHRTPPPSQLIERVKRPAPAPINIALINEDGGTGKTTVAVLLGLLFATLRNDQVIALDASPGCGELANRTPRESHGRGSVRSLVEQIDYITRYAHVREHTTQLPCRLEVLGSDPSVIPESEFTGEHYDSIIEIIRTFYNVIITDCAAGMLSSVVDAVLEDADVLVIVSEGSDGVRAGYWTANFLMQRSAKKPHYKQLLEDAVVVVNSRTENTRVNTKKVVGYYEQICRAAVELPFDKHLEGGDTIELDALASGTYNQLLAIAAAVTASKAFD
jgi:MinD-like ATPase involved in chromosome partitioning or flagellar assembly